MSEAVLPAKKMTFRQIAKSPVWIGTASVLVLGGVLLAAITLNGNSADPKPKLEVERLTVRVQSAQLVDSVAFQQTFAGEIRARRNSELAFERSARITEILVDEGDQVAENQPLAILDKRDLVYAKNRAIAALANAQAVLKELKDGPRQEVIAAAEKEVSALKAEKALAEYRLKRRDDLRNSTSISPEEWQQAKSVFDAADARLQSAESKLAELVNGTRKEKITAQQALCDQLQAELDQIDLDLEKSTLRAPFAGRIASRMLDEGAVVSPGQTILEVSESSVLEAIVGIPPRLVADLDRNQIRDCMVDGDRVKAKIERVLPETDSKTRLIPIVFRIIDSNLHPGQILRVPIEDRRAFSGIWVPTEALLPGSKGLWTLFVVSDPDGEEGDEPAVAQMRQVELLFNKGEMSLIKGTVMGGEKVIDGVFQNSNAADTANALTAGEQVVIDGVQKITNGQQVVPTTR